jgi:hypothetical protein
MEVTSSSETSVHIRTTQCYIPEDGNSHNYCDENLKSYRKCIFFGRGHLNKRGLQGGCVLRFSLRAVISPNSPEHWNPEIVSCSNKRGPDIVVQQNERDEDVVKVAAVQGQEDEGQPCTARLHEHLHLGRVRHHRREEARQQLVQ